MGGRRAVGVGVGVGVCSALALGSDGYRSVPYLTVRDQEKRGRNTSSELEPMS